MKVPTNDELYENAPNTVREAVHGWLRRHVSPPAGVRLEGRDTWYNWAADNFMADPEIRGAWKKEMGTYE